MKPKADCTDTDGFDLINMNGRMYDPFLARFLSPDPLIKDATDTQSLNRYSYVLNNPLIYTDPSGYADKPVDWNKGRAGAIWVNPYFSGGYRGSMADFTKADTYFSWANMYYNNITKTSFAEFSFSGGDFELNGSDVYTYHNESPEFYANYLNPKNPYLRNNLLGLAWDAGRGNSGLGLMAKDPPGGKGHGSAGGGDLFRNPEGLQSIAFGISLGSGMWGEAARDLGKTTSTVTAEIQAAKVIGNIGKVARIGNIVGNSLSIGANSINVYNNPTPGNIGRLSVSVIATGANGLNLVIPGLGTGISIGISFADAAWGHYLYDGLDNYFETAP